MSVFYPGFIVWGEKSRVAEGQELPGGGSGGMLPRKCFQMSMRSDAIWYILRHNFEINVPVCALTSSRLDDFSDIVTYIL